MYVCKKGSQMKGGSFYTSSINSALERFILKTYKDEERLPMVVTVGAIPDVLSSLISGVRWFIKT